MTEFGYSVIVGDPEIEVVPPALARHPAEVAGDLADSPSGSDSDRLSCVTNVTCRSWRTTCRAVPAGGARGEAPSDDHPGDRCGQLYGALVDPPLVGVDGSPQGEDDQVELGEEPQSRPATAASVLTPSRLIPTAAEHRAPVGAGQDRRAPMSSPAQ